MAKLAERVRRHFLWVLLGSYVLAALAPGAGRVLATWSPGAAVDDSLGGWLAGGVRAPMLLVGALLLLAALSTDVASLRVFVRRPWLLGASLLGVWLGPVLAVGAAGLLSPMINGDTPSGLLLGLALVAAMPVANSSVGWTQQSGGNLAWSLGLVVASILLCPLVTPGLLRLAGLALSAREAAGVDALANELAGPSFILWVLLPTATGVVVRLLMGGGRVDRCRPVLQLSTAAVLLVLNYANGAQVATAFRESPPPWALVVAAAVATLALSVVGVVVAWWVSDLLRLDGPTRTALTYGLSMKHTGLALGLAAGVLADQPMAGLLIAVATPMQHLVASVLDRLAGGGDLGDGDPGGGDSRGGADPVADAPG